MKHFSFFVAFLVCQNIDAIASSDLLIEGNDFKVPATQQIRFVPQMLIEPDLYEDPSIPTVVDLKSTQSKVKNQGQRGTCTYFVITSLLESLIKIRTGHEIDISEEFIVWASKTKLNLRPHEEDSSVAVNAFTVQKLGFLLEKDHPYEPNWFDKGYPCEGLKGKSNLDPVCFAHHGPGDQAFKNLRDGSSFVFESVDSSSLDLVRALARNRTPVTASILGHQRSFENSRETGRLILTPKMKSDCQTDRKKCSGHAVLVVGYDLNQRIFTFKNSWGEDWGDHGYGTISFDYMDQLSERTFLTAKLRDKIHFP